MIVVNNISYELFKDACRNRCIDIITGVISGAIQTEFSMSADDNFDIHSTSETAGYIGIFSI
jgi:hypothetical protein